MSITFTKIYSNISSKYEIIDYNIVFQDTLTDILFITKSQESFDDNTLYIGFLDEMENKHISKKNFILIGDNEHSNINLSQNNIIVIKRYTNDIFEIFNYIKKIFINNLQVVNSSAILLNSLIEGKDLNYIVELAAKIVDNPIVLIDPSYKVLSASSKHDIKDPLWEKYIQMGYCSYEFIVEVKKLTSIKTSMHKNEPFSVTCSSSNIQKMVKSVSIKNKHIGYLIMFESNTKLTDRHLSLLNLISNIVAEELKKNDFYKNIKGFMYENFILDLLEGNITNEDIINERMNSVGLKFNDNIYVFSIDLENFIMNSKNGNDYLRDSIENIFTNSKSIFYKEKIILLAESNESYYFKDETINRLKKLADKENLQIGISTAFTHISNLKIYYNESIRALELSKVLNMKDYIICYESIRFYDLLSKVKSHVSIESFCHPSLLTLKHYDTNHNTNYYETLYLYILNNRNIIETAEKLYIHRNTMTYRINKIKELTNIDFKDSETIFQINYSFKILNYINNSITNKG